MSRASQEASSASQLARAAHSRGDLARAREQYERALGWQSDQMEPWSKLAVVVGETGAYREVREVVEYAIRKNVTDIPDLDHLGYTQRRRRPKPDESVEI